MKKWMLLLACLLMLLGSADASVSIRMEDTAALIREDGTELAAPGMYEDIVPIGGGWYAAETDGRYALMDEAGDCLTEAAFSELRFEGEMILAKKDGSWGILNPDGSVHCEFLYSLILPGQSRNCWALKDDPNDINSDKLYRIDAQGRQYATRLYLRSLSRSPSEGLLSVCLRGENLYGYCDVLGRMVIPAEYAYAGDFVDGLAAVVLNGKYGAIDRTGTLVIPTEYDFLEISGAGLVVAAKNGQGAWVFDTEGRQRDAFAGAEVYIALVGDGYAVIDSQFLFVFDRDGKMVLEAPSESVVLEGIGGQLIISDGMWGEKCVYLSGTRARYQNLYPLGTTQGRAIYACMEARVGRYMNDLLGEVQLSTDMDSARYGIVDADGEMIAEAVYLSLDFLSDDRLVARTEAAWQMIDARGNVLWEYAVPMQTEAPSSAADS